MQQTNKYKLNLIEKDDVFSPDPLNENMEKVEAALETKAAADDHADLDARVTVLEGHKFAAGYAPDESPKIYLGFTPKAVIAMSGTFITISLPDYSGGGLTIIPGGFEHISYVRHCLYAAFA